jgi:hypothetical protein
MVARWLEWATSTVERWPDDVTQAPFDVEAAQESVRVAEGIDAMLGPRRR